MKADIVKIVSLLSISALLFLLLTRCETESIDYENIDCNECYEEKPQYSYLKIIFSEDICDTVNITVFRGYVNESMIEWQGWATNSPFYFDYIPVNNFYSVKATYSKDAASIGVVDAEKLETHLIKGVCDNNCYIITGGEYDVELK
ncbi:MAG: hypothetical protein U9N51_04515 [Bacteroidota bacterium]|nr:hypothetical protein [Bacteroidota bacterium]